MMYLHIYTGADTRIFVISSETFLNQKRMLLGIIYCQTPQLF